MSSELESLQKQAKDRLDAHTVEMVQWHFHDSTGCPFWLEKKAEFNFDPLTEIRGFDDLLKFPLFEDEWLRGGPISRWVPKGYADRPIHVFETGGSTGVPKARISIDDFRTDYQLFSDTLPDAPIEQLAVLRLDGEMVEPSDGGRFKTISPSTEEVLSEVAEAGQADVDAAVRAARTAYTRVWSKMSGAERAKYLFRIARIVQRVQKRPRKQSR